MAKRARKAYLKLKSKKANSKSKSPSKVVKFTKFFQ